MEHAHNVYSKVENLGEGAWHRAWKVMSDKHDPVVLRVPKNGMAVMALSLLLIA